MNMKKGLLFFFALCTFASAYGYGADDPNLNTGGRTADKTVQPDPNLPSLFLIGDSTVKRNVQGSGWGYFLGDYFDSKRINFRNFAIGGRSSRSVIEEGRWQRVLDEMKPGDFVLLQLGHNDGSFNKPERYSLKGIGEETQDANHPKTGEPIKIHTYGWYLRKYAADTKAKGGTLIFITPVLRNSWLPDGTNDNSMGQYAEWMRQVAAQEKTLLIDLNKILMKKYAEIGKDRVSSEFFTTEDKTHTSAEGSRFSAQCVAKAVRELKDCHLRDYLLKK